ncbi:MAG: DNA-directed RNA polymerase subunit alpha [Chlamydiia bacterium]|nr:DNA-directed RNA polymerase subunit alpha [Chlamydiia bacterium]
MPTKYAKFELPESIRVDKEAVSPTFARFIAEPFERGFGHTMGNALRRVMLTSLEAPAIVSVSIEGVPHEFSSIEGVIEDMINVILNIKGALIRRVSTEGSSRNSHDYNIVTGKIDVTKKDLDAQKGQVAITLKDVFQDGAYELINPDMVLMTVTKPMQRRIQFRVGIGRGYVPAEAIDLFDKTSDEIVIDAPFSPVRQVNYFVENTRVREETDFDRVVLEVTTDGRVTPTEALTFASQILQKHFEVFFQVNTSALVFDEECDLDDSDDDSLVNKLVLRIDEIELSVRSTNCLAGANIETIAELVVIPERRMLEFRNFGKKSLNEIKQKLHDMHLHLGMDLHRLGITPDNVREKVRAMIKQRKAQESAAAAEV